VKFLKAKILFKAVAIEFDPKALGKTMAINTKIDNILFILSIYIYIFISVC